MLSKFWAIARGYDDKAMRLVDLEMQGWASPNATGKVNRAKSEPVMQIFEREAAAAATGQGSGGNVAVISLVGVMTKYASMCYYGTKDVIAAIENANADDKISAIVLVCDTPGGTVDGTDDLARAIAASQKPVVGYIDGCCCSAGYWAVSQTREIFVNSESTALVGSIGVICTYVNMQRALEAEGIEVRLLRAPESPDKQSLNPYEPATEEAIAEATDYLAAVRTRFVASIEQGRGNRLTEAGRKAGITGRTFTGRTAMDFGLVDKQGTLREAIARAADLAALDARTGTRGAFSQSADMDQIATEQPAAEPQALETAAPVAEATPTTPETPAAPAHALEPALTSTQESDALARIEASLSASSERMAAIEQRLDSLAAAVDGKPTPAGATGEDLVSTQKTKAPDPVTARAIKMWG